MYSETIARERNVLLVGIDTTEGSEIDIGGDVSIRQETRACDAIDCLLDAQIDCVVSAYELPDTDGLRFLQTVRTKYPDLSLILYPSDGSEDLASDALAAGATDYLPNRDGNRDELARRIASAVSSSEKRNAVGKRSDLLSRAFESIDDALYLLDETGQFILWNDTVEDFTGYDTAEISSMRPVDFFEGADRNRVRHGIERAIEGETVKVEAEIVPKDGEPFPVEFTGHRLTDDSGELIGICGVGRDITERKRREEALRERESMLTALQNATHPLMGAETSEDIVELSVETAAEVLDLSYVAIYLFDRAIDDLRPAAVSSDLVGGSTLSDGDVLWESYISGEERICNDLIDERHSDQSEADIGCLATVPLGDHGVFVAGDREADAFDELDLDFAELLAANTETALDRAQREEQLRERDSKLDQRNKQLEELNRINSVIRDIDQALVGASSRTEIEQEVCERLVETEPYQFARICESGSDGGLRTRSWAGVNSRYIDKISDNVRNLVPAAETVRNGEYSVVNDLFQDRQTEGWRQKALKHGYRSVVSIPLVYQEASYGVIEIYSGEFGSFDDETIEILMELGETIGHAINSIHRKDALVSERVVRLEFDIRRADDFWARAARELEATLDIRGFAPREDGASRVFVEATDESGREFDTVVAESTIVDSVSRVSDREDGSLYKCLISGSTTVTRLAEYGAAPRKVVAGSDGEHVVVDLAREAEVSEFIETVTAHYPGVELRARREKTRSVEPKGSFRNTVTDRLTDRQREVLQIAYLHDFFNWPRGATGEEVAESLDIAPSTFHQHIRTAQRKLLNVVFE